MEQLIPAILAGLIGSACAWFVFARQLVTRKEVQDMIRDRMEGLATMSERQERMIDDMRVELIALRGEVIKLGVLLGVTGARDLGLAAGKNDTKGS